MPALLPSDQPISPCRARRDAKTSATTPMKVMARKTLCMASKTLLRCVNSVTRFDRESGYCLAFSLDWARRQWRVIFRDRSVRGCRHQDSRFSPSVICHLMSFASGRVALPLSLPCKPGTRRRLLRSIRSEQTLSSFPDHALATRPRTSPSCAARAFVTPVHKLVCMELVCMRWGQRAWVTRPASAPP